ncbi:secretory calcium-binding phosphoprotein 9 [Eucyclogobius newberryi]|uniref:secretory calcium-binding phosphoprotein 9 n=1 Tax=Eucyclogobius newberryi TaxID=166745 RepID=UPI003B5A69BD
MNAMNAMNAMGMGANPAAGGLLGGGLVRPVVIPGGAGFIGQPQFPQFMPALPAYGVAPAPFPNMYPAPAPAANQFPYMGLAQMGPFNPAQPLPQQQVMGGLPMGNIQQQPQMPFPAQPGPLQRFRRQVMIPDNTADTTLDTQIPPPTEHSRPCNTEATNPNN